VSWIENRATRTRYASFFFNPTVYASLATRARYSLEKEMAVESLATRDLWIGMGQVDLLTRLKKWGQWVTGAGPKFKNGLKGSERIDPMDTMDQPTHHINIFFKKILVFFFFRKYDWHNL